MYDQLRTLKYSQRRQGREGEFDQARRYLTLWGPLVLRIKDDLTSAAGPLDATYKSPRNSALVHPTLVKAILDDLVC